MALPIRVSDLTDLLKLLVQSTTPTAPDNPAEVLSDYIAAPTSGAESVTTVDGVSITTHGSTYVYGDAAAIYGRAQWS